ncbi:MAG: hypothetical protein NTW28_25835 [Candidatus Solibacter sp.]|nr:hypothetical protein [Candidatus Solibacter sp.]
MELAEVICLRCKYVGGQQEFISNGGRCPKCARDMSGWKFFRRPAVLLALALCSVGGLVTLMGRLATGPQVAQKRVQLSAGEASEAYPAISPDGKRIAYSASESSKVSAYHVFVRQLPSGKPRQLTKAEGSDIAPVWSPDGGTLAFLRVTESKRECIVIPADGGDERTLATDAGDFMESRWQVAGGGAECRKAVAGSGHTGARFG